MELFAKMETKNRVSTDRLKRFITKTTSTKRCEKTGSSEGSAKSKRKYTKRKFREIESESSNDEELGENIDDIYDEESDLENLSLKDIVVEESDFENVEENVMYEPKKGDYILAKITSKITVTYYVAQVEKVRDIDIDVKYLRRKGQKFVEPSIEERYSLLKFDIEKKTAKSNIPRWRTAKRYYMYIQHQF